MKITTHHVDHEGVTHVGFDHLLTVIFDFEQRGTQAPFVHTFNRPPGAGGSQICFDPAADSEIVALCSRLLTMKALGIDTEGIDLDIGRQWFPPDAHWPDEDPDWEDADNDDI